MSASNNENPVALATNVSVRDDSLSVELSDGRLITVPVASFPRLANATAAQREHFRLIGKGEGIHWPEVDEDISVKSLLAVPGPGENLRAKVTWRIIP
jgi:hypothetical protein